MKVGVLSLLYPSKRNPVFGVFVREEMDSLADLADLSLIAPLINENWPGEPHSLTAPRGYPVIRPFVLSFPRWFFQPLSPPSLSLTLFMAKDFFADCDIVHVHNAFPEAAAAVNVFGSRLPIVVTVHGSDINICAQKASLRPGIVKALDASARVICISRDLERSLREMGVNAPIEIIPNGIDTALFTPGGKREACLKLGLDPERPRIIFTGNFLPVKGIEYLIGAMPEVARRFPDCELLLIGAGPGGRDSARFRAMLHDLGLEGMVRIVEKIPNTDIPSWMQASDVFALPSIREGFGIVAAEALACGRPVVATRSGGPEEIVEEGLGFLVPPRDSRALGEALVKALLPEGIASPEDLARSARSRFSLKDISRRIFHVYEDVLRERNREPGV
jgi:teichuronic acid biosynthesis glycosyltransferase TuaC